MKSAELIDFVTARIDDLEAVARQALPFFEDRELTVELSRTEGRTFTSTKVTWPCDAAWILRECYARRQAVEALTIFIKVDEDEPGIAASQTAAMVALVTLCFLASADSAHPDYRSEWKP